MRSPTLPDDGELGQEIPEHVAQTIREGLAQAPARAVAQRHLDAMVAVRAVGDQLARRRARRPVARYGRRRTMLAGFGLATGIFYGGGLAAAGELPSPLQVAVRSLVQHLGVELPARPADLPVEVAAPSPTPVVSAVPDPGSPPPATPPAPEATRSTGGSGGSTPEAAPEPTAEAVTTTVAPSTAASAPPSTPATTGSAIPSTTDVSTPPTAAPTTTPTTAAPTTTSPTTTPNTTVPSTSEATPTTTPTTGTTVPTTDPDGPLDPVLDPIDEVRDPLPVDELPVIDPEAPPADEQQRLPESGTTSSSPSDPDDDGTEATDGTEDPASTPVVDPAGTTPDDEGSPAPAPEPDGSGIGALEQAVVDALTAVLGLPPG